MVATLRGYAQYNGCQHVCLQMDSYRTRTGDCHADSVGVRRPQMRRFTVMLASRSCREASTALPHNAAVH
eukprot:2272976-Pleurochrysis_carterae.AAC.1